MPPDPNLARCAETVLAYHQRTKHRLDRYAAGPETLDWDAQPNPFREFAGSPRIALPLGSDHAGARFADLGVAGAVPPAPLSLAALSVLLELSMGLSAWKEYGPDRWALRCNPSSGNLHPTEAYVLARDVPGLTDGLYHYLCRDHVLEQRCRTRATGGPLYLGLSSIAWREAWKYGERAFRYCQLDIGHALGAIGYAAAVLGWRARVVESVDTAGLAALLGLDRDFGDAEHEDADLLLAIDTQPGTVDRAMDLPVLPGDAAWQGQANRLDPHPLYRWPVIDEVAAATRGQGEPSTPSPRPARADRPGAVDIRAADVILNRRSAQRFDRGHEMDAKSLFDILDALLPRATLPWEIWESPARVHPILFVHRVNGLEPGLYALPRRAEITPVLQSALGPAFAWRRVEGAPAALPLFQLQAGDSRRAIRTLSCHQAIAADCCVSFSLLAEFEPGVSGNPWHYRQLHWEAGLLGQVLYLEAEARGLNGTGIGCYFDDELHDLLGLGTRAFQALYHFTIGRALTDSRILASAAYPGRQRNEASL